MAQTRDESAPSRIELVVLACLSQSKPPSDADLGDALRQLALPTSSSDTARARALELVTGLARRGWVSGANDGAPAQRKLTDDGKRVLRKEFKLTRAPTWPQIRDRHLPSLALGLTPGSDDAKAACTESAMTAAVLCERFGVKGARNPVAVCDALVAAALGMPAGKLTLDRLRAHVLTRGMDNLQGAPGPETKSYAPKLAAWIASTAVGADGPPRKKMAYAIARRWVTGEANPLGMPVAPSAAPAAASTMSSPAATPTPSAVLAVAPTPPASPAASSPLAAVAPKAPPTLVSTPTPKPVSTSTAVSTPAGGTAASAPAADLLEVVRSTIPRIGNDGRFGEKVYVSAIWRTMNRDRKTGNMSFDHFKRWLVGANRDGRLVLARADLVGAMDAKQVTESEINDRGATFHFVLDQRNGTTRTQRENHAV